MIKIGGQFSGVGAFDFALDRLGVAYENVYQAEWDKYARQTYLENHSKPKWYVEDVYDTPINEIPSLDIAMFSPPCQAFSLAGKRKGENDKRGILFYNSHGFISTNKPRYFMFENVKGLLSDDNGKTFQRWLDYLGGKSVNGNPVIFPHEESVPYHIYWKVLNAKDYGVPQNRERVFIIGIRDDRDNDFSFPKPFHLTKKLKDVLEESVDEKYFLSDKSIKKLIDYDLRQKENGNGFGAKFHEENEVMSALKVGGGGCDDLIKIKSATSKGYETATENDSINFSQPNSETRRGRVGKEVAQTLDTSCNQGVLIAYIGRSEEGKKIRKQSMAKGKDFTPFQAKQIEFKESDVMNCVTTATTKDNLLAIGAIRGRGKDNEQQLEINETGNSNSLTTVQKDNVVIEHRGHKNKEPNITDNGIIPTLRAESHGHQPKIFSNYKIRRLTPREAFRLMDFPDTFKMPCSDTQMYRQAGNSIVVNVLAKIIERLKFG